MPTCAENAAKVEELLHKGCCWLSDEKRNGINVNIKQTACELGVPYTTLHACFLNVHKSHHKGHTHQQFLTPSWQNVLIQWIKHLGSTGHPICKWTIKQCAQVLHPAHKMPCWNWVYLFLQCHPDLVLSSPCSLDPKWAKVFNCPVVNHYFDNLIALVQVLGIWLKISITWMRKDVRGVAGKGYMLVLWQLA